MAEICAAHPDHFPGFIATLPMSSGIGRILEAARFAIEDAEAIGVQIYTRIAGRPMSSRRSPSAMGIFTRVAGRPLDDKEFAPLFDCIAKVDLTIWIHPARGTSMPDFASEEDSKYEI